MLICFQLDLVTHKQLVLNIGLDLGFARCFNGKASNKMCLLIVFLWSKLVIYSQN